jgi:hypothetical protein
MKNVFAHIKVYFADSVRRKRILFSFLGALGGYAYYYFVGCASGACPISSNPYISTIYGAGIGFAITLGEKKRPATD